MPLDLAGSIDRTTSIDHAGSVDTSTCFALDDVADTVDDNNDAVDRDDADDRHRPCPNTPNVGWAEQVRLAMAAGALYSTTALKDAGAI